MTREALMQHIKQKHLDYASYHCDPCQMGFNSKKKWDQHIYVHHSEQQETR